ncbi:CBS domain-containing protein [Rhodospirillales bacterium URHD0017]|nr:CBS domain-containing protein [Rhodospirillales bacterium URHD0017]
MRVGEVMSPGVQVARLDHTIQEAAKMMSEMDVGSLPVAQQDRLLGIITDRDIVVRAVAGNEPALDQGARCHNSGYEIVL